MSDSPLTIVIQGPTDSTDVLALTAEGVVVDVYNTSGHVIEDVEIKIKFKDDCYDKIEGRSFEPSRWEPGQHVRATLRRPGDARDVEEIKIKFKGSIDGVRYKDSVELDRDEMREECVFSNGTCLYKHDWCLGQPVCS
ncbi:MAG TPA: hypothetical protein VFF52_01535 [Isosphaeraceae bacterium]|nr:hypothetical protein [Isosphaeraceae bacterium]